MTSPPRPPRRSGSVPRPVLASCLAATLVVVAMAGLLAAGPSSPVAAAEASPASTAGSRAEGAPGVDASDVVRPVPPPAVVAAAAVPLVVPGGPGPRAMDAAVSRPSRLAGPDLGALSAQEEKVIAKLEKKLTKKAKKYAKTEDKLAAADDKLAEAEALLAAAEAMDDSTEQGAKAKAKALKKALKKLAKANKKVAKAQAKLDKNSEQQDGLMAQIEELDPGHFTGPQSAPGLLAEGGPGAVTFSWDPTPGAASYTLYWSLAPGVLEGAFDLKRDVESPLELGGLPPGFAVFGVVTATVNGVESFPSPEAAAFTDDEPVAPEGVTVEADGTDTLEVSWDPVPGALGYRVSWGATAGATGDAGTIEAVGTPPFVQTGLPAETTRFYRVSATAAGGDGPWSDVAWATTDAEEPGPEPGGEVYDPPWADVAPQQVIVFDYDPGKSQSQNASDLRAAIGGLQPGDRLEVGGGTYNMTSQFDISLVGTVGAPITIIAQEGEVPVITRPDATKNLLNMSGPTRYLRLSGFEFVGGSAGIRLVNCENVWIDRCHIHDNDESGITTNQADTDRIYLTRNHIHHTGGYGEGMYLGANHGAVVMSRSVIALNHVHDTNHGTLQGDGIELKQGSWGNWIVENYVHDTKYPCLLLYGTDGQPPNIVERNVLVGSDDNTLQVQGDAVVRNNLIMKGATGFQSNDHQGTSENLTFVHNTIINEGQAARLSNWNNRPGMVFANNVVYSKNSTAMQFSSGSNGATIAGNVVHGGVSGTGSGYVVGNGISDFVDAAWNASATDVTPAPGSPMLDAADGAHGVLEDLHGTFRGVPADVGAVEVP